MDHQPPPALARRCGHGGCCSRADDGHCSACAGATQDPCSGARRLARWLVLDPPGEFFLEAQGHRVYTPTLTGLGERSHLLRAGINLETHTTDVRERLQMGTARQCGARRPFGWRPRDHAGGAGGAGKNLFDRVSRRFPAGHWRQRQQHGFSSLARRASRRSCRRGDRHSAISCKGFRWRFCELGVDRLGSRRPTRCSR